MTAWITAPAHASTRGIYPVVGAALGEHAAQAWVIMHDVSEALARYDRARPLSPEALIPRVKTILAALARLHVLWEQPLYQQRLSANAWLPSCGPLVWREAANCARTLPKPMVYGPTPGEQPTTSYRANLAAFIDWLPAGDRPLWEQLV